MRFFVDQIEAFLICMSLLSAILIHASCRWEFNWTAVDSTADHQPHRSAGLGMCRAPNSILGRGSAAKQLRHVATLNNGRPRAHIVSQFRFYVAPPMQWHINKLHLNRVWSSVESLHIFSHHHQITTFIVYYRWRNSYTSCRVIGVPFSSRHRKMQHIFLEHKQTKLNVLHIRVNQIILATFQFQVPT